MAVTFLTNEDKTILDGQINKLTETTNSLYEEIGELFDPFFASGDYPRLNIPADLALNVSVAISPNFAGVSEIKVTRCGENLIDLAGLFMASFPSGTVVVDGLTATINEGVMHVTGTNATTGYVNVFRIRGINGAYCIPTGTYTIPDHLTLALSTNADGSSPKNYSGSKTFDQPMYLSSFYCAVGPRETADWEIPMTLLYGGYVPTTYIPYEGDSYSISLPQPCYGGTVNVTNGKVTYTHGLSADTQEVYPLDTPNTIFADAEYIASIKGVNFLYSFQGAVTVNGCANRLGGSVSADVGSNPEAFGAAGNGVADDTAAIQAAIDSGISLRFTGEYAVYGAITIPEGYLLDFGGCGVTMYDSGCFVVGKNAKLINARITYAGSGAAITIAGSHAMVLGCSVYGTNWKGYGVSATSENGMSFVVVRDCVFSYLSCGFYSNDAGYRNAFTLDFTATHCRQAINGSISGSYIKISGQSATLTANNNEVYQICIYGKLNTIIDKLYDVNANDSTHCSMGVYVEGNGNTIDSFEANTKATARIVGQNNAVISKNNGETMLGNTDPCFAMENFGNAITSDIVSINTELTTADENMANEILSCILEPKQKIAIVTMEGERKIVIDIEKRITRLEYLFFLFGAYYTGVKKISATLLSELDEEPDIEISTENINRVTMLYGNGSTRSLSSYNYTKLRLTFEFFKPETVSGTVDFLGVSGLIY